MQRVCSARSRARPLVCGRFIPFAACAALLLNAASGLVLWQDWRSIDMWISYGGIYVQVLLGVYLLSAADLQARAYIYIYLQARVYIYVLVGVYLSLYIIYILAGACHAPRACFVRVCFARGRACMPSARVCEWLACALRACMYVVGTHCARARACACVCASASCGG